jgi:hypothetical protein
VEGALVAKKRLSAEEKAADKAARKEAERGTRAWKLISTAIPLASDKNGQLVCSDCAA